MSPATKMPRCELMYRSSRATLPRGVVVDVQQIQPRAVLGPDEAEGEEHEVGGDLPLGPLDLGERAVDHLDLVQDQRPHSTVAVVDEPLGVDAEEPVAALLVGGGDLVHHRELRPRVGRCPAPPAAAA